MKTTFIVILLALSSFSAATDYYVKTGGNDLASGTSDATAWATINKVNSIFSVLKPGDRILFKRGNIFYGTIKITKTGASGSPITLGAYGTGDKPIITGFTAISSWTNEGNGIYSASLKSEGLTNMVVIENKQYAMGRWPDDKYNIFESAVTNLSITDNELGTAIDWTGAEVVIRKNDWSLDRCKVTDHTGDKLTYSSLGSVQNAEARHGYFIQNDKRTLSAYGEWYHDVTAGKIYIYFGSNDPATKKVEVASLNNLVYDTGNDYITIDNIHFKGSASTMIGFITNANDYITIQNSQFTFAGLDVINLWGNYGNITNNLISSCNQTAIMAVGTQHKVTSNIIEKVGLIAGQAFWGNLANGIGINNNDCLIKNNTLRNIGYSGIKLSSSADVITIQNNFIHDVLLTLSDGAGIYTAGEGTSRKVDGNIILNVKGNTDGTPYPDRHIARGIYLDVNSTNVIITNNTVAHCSEGGYMIHRSHENKLDNNTAFSNGYGMFFQNNTESNIRNNTLTNNIFFAKSSSQLSLKFYSGTDDIPAFGTADNNYYARPVDDDDVFHTYSPSTGSKYRTLASWQTFTSQDRNSKKSPVSVNDTSKIDFYYNPTTSNKTYTLAQPMIDVKGTKYAGSVTLLPYRSVILMPDPNPYTPPVPSFSGAVIENAAPSVIVMTYSLSLANIAPAATAFAVKVNGTSRTVNSVTVSGTKVQLTLASPVIYGDAVTVAYTKPVTNPLQTSEGAQAASLSAHTVTNNCIAPVTPQPQPQPQPPPNQPPVVSISSPVKGSSYTSPATVVIDVEAYDNDGSVHSVILYNGNVKIAERTAAPYSFSLKNLDAGEYSLHATATDNLNSTTTSSVLDFEVKAEVYMNENFSLYPNPNDGRFSIDIPTKPEAERYTVKICDILGNVVYNEVVPDEVITHHVDLSNMQQGMYVLIISADRIIHTQKFIKG
ncbi:MAG: right-handed parallel beta-helix repeat-containing protein [Bacteroidales bacterium]|nr:right-handed parallel beta-helix repeat-containing protein [Bacteroidales bacterium]